MGTEATWRLFFALPCPVGLATRIVAWRDGLTLGGQPIPAANLHLTLAFLGSLPQDCLGQLLAIGDNLRSPAFSLQLDRLERLGNGYICLVPSQAPAALLHLAATLRQRLLDAGIACDGRPFLPHLSLLRRSPAPPQGAPPFDWQVHRFGLYRSENTPGGVHYHALGSWPLMAAPGR